MYDNLKIKSPSKSSTLTVNFPTLIKHPSVGNMLKNLENKKIETFLDKDENIKENTNEESTNIDDATEDNKIYIDNDKEYSEDFNLTPENFKIIIKKTESDPLYDSNDIFYIKNDKISNEDLIKKNNDYYLVNRKQKHLLYMQKRKHLFSFNEEERKLDKLITEHIQNGDSFELIAHKFNGRLKKDK